MSVIAAMWSQSKPWRNPSAAIPRSKTTTLRSTPGRLSQVVAIVTLARRLRLPHCRQRERGGRDPLEGNADDGAAPSGARRASERAPSHPGGRDRAPGPLAPPADRALDGLPEPRSPRGPRLCDPHTSRRSGDALASRGRRATWPSRLPPLRLGAGDPAPHARAARPTIARRAGVSRRPSAFGHRWGLPRVRALVRTIPRRAALAALAGL